jgi:hypothetical protein
MLRKYPSSSVPLGAFGSSFQRIRGGLRSQAQVAEIEDAGGLETNIQALRGREPFVIEKLYPVMFGVS